MAILRWHCAQKTAQQPTTVPSQDHPRVCNTQTTTGPILEQNRTWPVPPPTWSYTWPFFCFLTKHPLPVNSLLLSSVASALVGAPVLAFACLSPLATACLFITANKRGFILRMACYASWSRCNREIKWWASSCSSVVKIFCQEKPVNENDLGLLRVEHQLLLLQDADVAWSLDRSAKRVGMAPSRPTCRLARHHPAARIPQIIIAVARYCLFEPNKRLTWCQQRFKC